MDLYFNYSNFVVFSEGPAEIWTVAVCPFKSSEYKISHLLEQKLFISSLRSNLFCDRNINDNLRGMSSWQLRTQSQNKTSYIQY